VSEGLENAKLINIAKEPNPKPNDSDSTIGIIFPLYYFGLPVIVEQFLQQLNISPNTYVFIIVTRGVSIAGGAKRQLDMIFHAKGRRYQFFRYITMGNNYPFYSLNGSTKQLKARRNKQAEEKTSAMLPNIKAKKQSRIFAIPDCPPLPAVTYKLPTFGYRHFLQIYKRDTCFVLDETLCNTCKKCEHACPTGNIEAHSSVEWKHENCQMCLACYNCCPKNAIQYIDPQYKVNTKGKRQYWNPMSSV